MLQSDTNWILSQSPIVIDRKVVVRPSTELVVQAGVSVVFNTSDAGMDVYGECLKYGEDAKLTRKLLKLIGVFFNYLVYIDLREHLP